MPKYIDGFVVAVPNDQTEEYKELKKLFDTKRMAYGGFAVEVAG